LIANKKGLEILTQMEERHILISCLLLLFGYVIDRYYDLSRWYITPPIIGGSIGALIIWPLSQFSSLSIIPSGLFLEFVLGLFIFTVGVKMGLAFTFKHWKHVVLLLLSATLIVVLIDRIVSLVNNRFSLGENLFVLGSMTFAWNLEWIEQLQHISLTHSDLTISYHLSLLFVFILSPIFLMMMRRRITRNRLDRQTSKSFNVNESSWLAIFISISITSLSIFLDQKWFNDVVFMFSYVLTMFFGFVCGKLLYYKKQQKYKQSFNSWLNTFQYLGVISLYLYIVAMFLTSSSIIYREWSWSIAILLLIKIGIITLLYLLLISRVKNHRHLLLIGAFWAFTLSAPVVCMNNMNCVVKNYGEADDLMLLFPIVVLWLINYPHYFILLWLYG
jgi:Na+/glutamate symporter